MGPITVAGFAVLTLAGLLLILAGAYRRSRPLVGAGGALLGLLALAWLFGLGFLLQATGGSRAKTATWTDDSPHSVRFVEVAPGVLLEVLDWGGSGPPLVFLAGLQDVAHGFDDFAPRFTDQYHVLAITRRGYGASSQPPAGYDVSTRVQDLRSALDALGLPRVTLVGHSIAGDELTGFAAQYPDRVASLVYLDAVYDHSGILEMLAGYPPPPPMTAADSASPAAVKAYLRRTFGQNIPQAQLRAIGRYDAAGRLVGDVTPAAIDAMMIEGVGHPDYRGVRAPALVINAVVDSMPDVFPAWRQMNAEDQAVAVKFTATIRQWAATRMAQVKRELPGVQVVELHGANHYVFDSNAAEVTTAMRTFLGTTTR